MIIGATDVTRTVSAAARALMYRVVGGGRRVRREGDWCGPVIT
jgi:hypothetical protein